MCVSRKGWKQEAKNMSLVARNLGLRQQLRFFENENRVIIISYSVIAIQRKVARKWPQMCCTLASHCEQTRRLCRLSLADCRQTLRHPQNRNYATYRNGARDRPSHSQRQHAQSNLAKSARAVLEICDRTDKQTTRTQTRSSDTPLQCSHWLTATGCISAFSL